MCIDWFNVHLCNNQINAQSCIHSINADMFINWIDDHLCNNWVDAQSCTHSINAHMWINWINAQHSINAHMCISWICGHLYNNWITMQLWTNAMTTHMCCGSETPNIIYTSQATGNCLESQSSLKNKTQNCWLVGWLMPIGKGKPSVGVGTVVWLFFIWEYYLKHRIEMSHVCKSGTHVFTQFTGGRQPCLT